MFGRFKNYLHSPIFWGAIGTAAYVAGFSVFLWWFGQRPQQALNLNEVGDFFAGAFAPVAFVWLVVAVFLQKYELSEQRKQLKLHTKELKLQRGELRLTHDLQREQGEELKEQSASLAKQTEAIEQDNLTKYIEARVDQLSRVLIVKLRSFRYESGYAERSLIDVGGGRFIQDMLSKDQFPEALRQISSRIRTPPTNKVNYLDTASLAEEIDLLKSIRKEAMANKKYSHHFQGFEFEKLENKLEFLQETHIAK